MSTSDLDAAKIEFNQEQRTANVHRMDSLNLLIFTTLLVVVVLTIWMFKRRNFRYLHETCVALIYGKRKRERKRPLRHHHIHAFEGFIIGAVLRYTTAPVKKTDTIRINDTSMFKNVTPNWISFE
jgi:hypothetical protein